MLSTLKHGKDWSVHTERLDEQVKRNLEERKSQSEKANIYHTLPTVNHLAEGKRKIFAFDLYSTPGVGFHEHEKFDQRAIAMATEKDIVLSFNTPEQAYLDYIARIGVGPGNIIAVGNDGDKRLLEGVERYKDLIPHLKDSLWIPYYTGTKDLEAGTAISKEVLGSPDVEVTLKYYNKDSFKEVCKQAGVPTVEGDVFIKSNNIDDNRRVLRAMIEKYIDPDTKSVIMRPTDGSGGAEILFADMNNIDEQIEKILGSESPKYLIEEKKDLEESLNAFGAIYDGKVELFTISEQILKDTVAYDGSIFNFSKAPNPKIKEFVQKIGQKMIDDNYNGPFGINFITTKKGEIFPVENNARINGSHSVHEFAQNLKEQGKDFNNVISFIIKLPKPVTFAELQKDKDISSLLYDGTNKAGIFPYSTDYLLKEATFKCIALAHSDEEAHNIKEAITNALFAHFERKAV